MTGVGYRTQILTSYSRRQPTLAGDRLDVAGAVECRSVAGDLELSCSQTAKRNLRPYVAGIEAKRSGAAEGVGDGPRPAPVQIDHSGRRAPFSGL